MSRRRRSCSFVLAALLLAGAPALAAAQQPALQAADSLLRAGLVFRAESLYYTALRRAPRDPEARLALGRYLAARGALKVGAVLMEEARFFGGDPHRVARDLAPVYARMGDWRALALLPASPLTPQEHSRAAWLRGAPPSHQGPDSVIVPLDPAPDGLGRIALTIGNDVVEATVDPSVRGLVLDSAWRRRAGLKTFGQGTETIGVVPSLKVGAITLTNVEAAFVGGPGGTSAGAAGARGARIGLDVLAAFTPTFDPAGRRLVLRRGGRLPARGERVATLVLPTGLWLVRPTDVIPLGSERGRAVTGDQAWTLHARRGEIVFGR